MRTILVLGGCVLAGALAACANDTSDDGNPTTTSTTTTTTNAGGGGAGGDGNGGSAGGGPAFWTGSYDPNGLPNPANGNHHAGGNCMSCHNGTGNAPKWLFAGTVYQQNGTTAAAHVEVGVLAGGQLYSAYSATNGNFWIDAATAGNPTIDWTNADVRARNANGELAMTTATPAAACNSCHSAGGTAGRITAP